MHRGGSQPLPLDGRDAWSTIAEGASSPHEEIVLNTTPQGGALRAGDWKLVVNGSATDDEDEKPAANRRQRQAGNDQRTELFNLASDPYEKNNVAAQQPEKVRDLQNRLARYAAQAVAPKAEPRAAGFQVPRVWGQKD